MKSTKVLCACVIASLFLSNSAFAANLNSKKVNVTSVQLISMKQKTSPNRYIKVGQSSERSWKFEAVQAGTYKLTFSYARPWEKDVPAAKTVEYAIEVSDKNNDNTKDYAVPVLKLDSVNKLNKGQKFSIELEQNGSTGFSWNYSGDTKAVKLISDKIIDPEVIDEPICGAPSERNWEFEAAQAGTYKLTFSYARCWEKGVPAAKTVEYTIEVSDKNNDNTKDYEVPVLKSDSINKLSEGQKFSIELEQNGSTGFSWSYSGDTKAVKLISDIEVGMLK